MRSIFTLAMGFAIARYIYINLDKKEAREYEVRVKDRLEKVLQKVGLNSKEVQERSEEILSTN